jgi:putative MATE family efflux protein
MSNASRAVDLLNGPIGKAMWAFSLPVLGSNVLQSLNASVNSIWIGRFLGESALTAAANANSVLFLLLGLVFGIAMATGILIGHTIGARDLDQAKRVVGTSATFFLTLSTAVALIGIVFAPQLLRWMQTPADALPFAVSYLRIIFIAIPPMFAYQYVMMALRGAGDARTPFLFMLLSVFLDIALNPLLIFGWGPVPALGIAGSASATLIAQTSTLIALIVYLYRKKHFLVLHKNELSYLKPDKSIMRTLIFRGIPMGMQMMVVSLSMLVMITLINRHGSSTTAAYGAAMQIWNYIQMPAFAIGSAVSTMAAQNMGAGLWNRVTQIVRSGLLLNLYTTGSCVVVAYLLERFALRLFLPDDPQTLAIALHLNAIVLWTFILFGASMVWGGVCRAAGAVYVPLACLFVSQWLVRLPFAYLLEPHWGADAIWWSYVLSSSLSVVLNWIYYRMGSWKKVRMAGVANAEPVVVAESAGA